MTKSAAKDWAARATKGGVHLDGADIGWATCPHCHARIEGAKHPAERDPQLGVRRALVAHLVANHR